MSEPEPPTFFSNVGHAFQAAGHAVGHAVHGAGHAVGSVVHGAGHAIAAHFQADATGVATVAAERAIDAGGNRRHINDPLQDKTDAVTNTWTAVAFLGANNQKPARDSTTITTFPAPKHLACEEVKLRGERGSPQFLQLRLAKIDEDATEIVNTLQNVAIAAEDAIRQVLPEDEKLFYYDSNTQAEAIGRHKFWRSLPSSEVYWDAATIETNRGLSLFTFYGLGQAFLTVVRSPLAQRVNRGHIAYEVDVTFLSKYRVRKGFAKYGAVAFFDDQKQPVAIYLSAEDNVVYSNEGNADWLCAMAMFRGSVITAVTLMKHLGHTHLVIANGLNLAARETLSSTHPLRRLVKPHHYNTTSINLAAFKTLLAPKGIAYYTFGIDHDDFVDALADCVDAFEYKLFPAAVAATGLSGDDVNELPWFRDGLELWTIVRRYVGDYLLLFYPERDTDVQRDPELVAYWDHYRKQQLGARSWFGNNNNVELSFDALADQVAFTIFGVTAGHQFYGAIVEYLLSPNVAPSKLAPHSTKADLQSFNLSLCLIALTGNKMPELLSDWTHLHNYLVDHRVRDLYSSSVGIVAISRDFTQRELLHDNVLRVLSTFVQSLHELDIVIDQRNIQRDASADKKRFVSCKPSVLDCSVSI